jgi:hypothetical protein
MQVAKKESPLMKKGAIPKRKVLKKRPPMKKEVTPKRKGLKKKDLG